MQSPCLISRAPTGWVGPARRIVRGRRSCSGAPASAPKTWRPESRARVTASGEVDPDGERQMEQASRRRAYCLGVVEIHRVAAHQHRVSSECIGTSDHCAEVARIADLITEHDQPRIARKRFSWQGRRPSDTPQPDPAGSPSRPTRSRRERAQPQSEHLCRTQCSADRGGGRRCRRQR